MPLTEKQKKYQREYYIKNREKRLEYYREYRVKNREMINKKKQQRRKSDPAYRIGRYINKERPSVPIKIRRELIARAKERCEESHKPPCKGALSIHHIDENCENNELSNLQLLCRRHHMKKHIDPMKWVGDSNPRWMGDKASKYAKRRRKVFA